MTTEKEFRNALFYIDTAINAATLANNWVEEYFENDPEEDLIGVIRDGSPEMDLVKAIDSLFAAKEKMDLVKAIDSLFAAKDKITAILEKK
jgi:hypothetical protein